MSDTVVQRLPPDVRYKAHEDRQRGTKSHVADQIQPDSKSMELVVALAGKSMNDIYHTKASKEKSDSNHSGWVSDFIHS